jgi:hypothetical protein
MSLLCLVLLVSLASGQIGLECDAALINLVGSFQMLPDSAEAFTRVFRTLCLQYELENVGTGITFPIWVDGYKSHMALDALLGSVQVGFETLLSAQVWPSTTRLLAEANAVCTPQGRLQAAKEYSSVVQSFAQQLQESHEVFAERFRFYTNATFAGDAFAVSNLLLAYGQNVTAALSA